MPYFNRDSGRLRVFALIEVTKENDFCITPDDILEHTRTFSGYKMTDVVKKANDYISGKLKNGNIGKFEFSASNYGASLFLKVNDEKGYRFILAENVGLKE